MWDTVGVEIKHAETDAPLSRSMVAITPLPPILVNHGPPLLKQYVPSYVRVCGLFLDQPTILQGLVGEALHAFHAHVKPVGNLAHHLNVYGKLIMASMGTRFARKM